MFGPFPVAEIRSILTDKGFVWRTFPGYSPSCREALVVGIWGDWSHGICVLEAELDRCYHSIPFILLFQFICGMWHGAARLRVHLPPPFHLLVAHTFNPNIWRQRQVDL